LGTEKRIVLVCDLCGGVVELKRGEVGVGGFYTEHLATDGDEAAEARLGER
jgi:hypothetical protein